MVTCSRNFPIELSEPLSAPVRIADVTRNGLPEIIAATRDRMIHVLDQRGNNITGWPQSVNSPGYRTTDCSKFGQPAGHFCLRRKCTFRLGSGWFAQKWLPCFQPFTPARSVAMG